MRPQQLVGLGKRFILTAGAEFLIGLGAAHDLFQIGDTIANGLGNMGQSGPFLLIQLVVCQRGLHQDLHEDLQQCRAAPTGAAQGLQLFGNIMAGLALLEQVDGLALLLRGQPHAVHHSGGPLDLSITHGAVALGHPPQCHEGGLEEGALNIGFTAFGLGLGDLIDAAAELDDGIELMAQPATQHRAHHAEDASPGQKIAYEQPDYGANPDERRHCICS